MTENAYDEAYFEDGSERGTQYSNYLEGAPRNRFYFEIAQAIAEVFRPKRTLEIGCAPGVVVSHLATFDIEPHGIDVSEWAIANRFHENVILASADRLPYDDGYFDVVYSIHALEHLPTFIAPKALSEISRVCSGVQLHLMPMLESGPYVGDRFGHLVNLRTDPTHNLLFEKDWWRKKFEDLCWRDTDLQIALSQDSEHFEFSDCQILLNKENGKDFSHNVAKWNFKTARLLSQALHGRPTCGLDAHITRLVERFR